MRVGEADGQTDPLNYQMTLTIKNMKNLEILDSSFQFSNLEKKKIIYTHVEEEALMVCMVTDVEVYLHVKIDVVLSLEPELPVTSDFYEMENTINRTRMAYADFNGKGKRFEELEKEVLEENLSLNSKIIRTSFLQMIVLVVLGVLQLGILRWSIQRKKSQ